MGTSLSAEPLLALAVTVTSEQHVDSVLQSIVRGLASQPGVALARIWLLHRSTSPALPTLSRIIRIVFVSSQARELPSIHRVKSGPSCRGTLLECGSVSERSVKWQQAGIRFLSKTSPPKTIGLCDQSGRNVRRFAVLQVIRSSFEIDCWGLSLSSAGTLGSTRVHLVGSVCESCRGRYRQCPCGRGSAVERAQSRRHH